MNQVVHIVDPDEAAVDLATPVSDAPHGDAPHDPALHDPAADGATPGAGTLAAVLAVWESVLQRRPIGPDDDFFDVGGDSLLGIQMFAELERVTGRTLPMTAIYDAATPRQLARLLDAEPGDGRPGFSPLVLLNDGPGGPPVFLIHGIGGHVMELARLGRSIEPDRRVYAIQARGLDGIETPIDTVDGMADYYLTEIRRVQPAGPYVLVGYSFGGMIALEMAKRLVAAGEAIGFLGFIDAYPHPNRWPRLLWLDVRWRRAANGARERLWARWPGLMGALQRHLGGGAGGNRFNALVRPFMFDEDWPEAVKRVYDISLGALERYEPSSYDGPVVFFRAARRSFYLPNNPRRMWGKLIPRFEIVTVPGDHMEMVDQKAASLGGALATRIRAGLAAV